MSKQRRLTFWLKTREGEPPAKHGRQDTENSAEGDSPATVDSASLSSSSDAHGSCFDPGRLSTSNVALQSYSKPYDIGNIVHYSQDLNKEDIIPLISTHRDDKYIQRQSGRYYIMTHNNTKKKKSLLEEIAVDLDEPLTVEIV